MGLDVMKKEFGYPGTARLMLKDVSLYEAKQYKDKIQAIDGVDQVLWCDTTVNVYEGKISSIWMTSRITTRTAVQLWISPLRRNPIPRNRDGHR